MSFQLSSDRLTRDFNRSVVAPRSSFSSCSRYAKLPCPFCTLGVRKTFVSWIDCPAH